VLVKVKTTVLGAQAKDTKMCFCVAQLEM